MKRLGSWMVLLLAPLAGCGAALPGMTSGQIGCPADDIRIVSQEPGFGTATWTAECHGKLYYCSAVSGGAYGGMQVSCKERAGGRSEAPPPPAPAGCQYDTQCKGDRVCKSGACVSPAQ